MTHAVHSQKCISADRVFCGMGQIHLACFYDHDRDITRRGRGGFLGIGLVRQEGFHNFTNGQIAFRVIRPGRGASFGELKLRGVESLKSP